MKLWQSRYRTPVPKVTSLRKDSFTLARTRPDGTILHSN
jgi:hypothetical protein